MRKPAKEQRLAVLEQEFEPLLLRCLRECAEQRRWGLLGQNTSPEAQEYER